MSKFHEVFAIGGVLRTISGYLLCVDPWGVSESSPLLACEEEGTAKADRADGVEFVGVEDHPRLERLGAPGTAETMVFDAMDDAIDQVRSDAVVYQDLTGHPSPFSCVTDGTPRLILAMPPDVVEQGCQFQHHGISALRSADMEREMRDALRMLPSVAAAHRSKMGFGFPADLFYGGPRDAHGEGNQQRSCSL